MSTLTFVPCSRKSGTEISAPVSSVANQSGSVSIRGTRTSATTPWSWRPLRLIRVIFSGATRSRRIMRG